MLPGTGNYVADGDYDCDCGKCEGCRRHRRQMYVERANMWKRRDCRELEKGEGI